MDKKNILLLSNVTVDIIKNNLAKKFRVFSPDGFDTWISEIYNLNSNLYHLRQDAIIVLLDGTEFRDWEQGDDYANSRIETWEMAITFLLEHVTNIPVFISTIDIQQYRIRTLAELNFSSKLQNEWYNFIGGCIEKFKNTYILEFAEQIYNIGRNNFYSDKMWYMGSMPYSLLGVQSICNEIELLLNSYFLAKKKIVVLDLDNTLWGGVVGEDGINGIHLSARKSGKRFYDFQRALKMMKDRGVLLAIISKNNQEDVDNIFDNHPDMFLSKNDFVSTKINWNLKSDNLKAIKSDLNLSEGSFLFIDDNPLEREIIKGECPEVTVPDFPEDTTKLRFFAEELYRKYLRVSRLLEEDIEKTNLYFSELKRKEILNKSGNFDDYISQLEIEIDIHKIRASEIARAAQLCNKTNQFNLTTKRYTESDLSNIIDNPRNSIFVFYSNDKYGKEGLIGLIITKKERNRLLIDTFLMSCRVMGRRIEEVVINEVINFFNSDVRYVDGEYIKTRKNVPVEDLYDLLGFKLIGKSGLNKKYSLDINNWEYKKFKYYKKIELSEV